MRHRAHFVILLDTFEKLSINSMGEGDRQSNTQGEMIARGNPNVRANNIIQKLEERKKDTLSQMEARVVFNRQQQFLVQQLLRCVRWQLESGIHPHSVHSQPKGSN